MTHHRRSVRSRTVAWTALALTVLFLLTFMTSRALAANNPCHVIVHRGFHTATLDEETVPSVEQSGQWGWGAEIDVRVTADDGLIAVHDDRLTRITGGADTRQPETMTMDELRAVVLEHGGQLASARRLVRAAKDADENLMIEGKRYPEHTAAWEGGGLAALGAAVTDLGMTDHVWVGGTLGFTRAFHAVAPSVQTFWRADADEPLTTNEVYKRYATLIEAEAGRWTIEDVAAFKAQGLIPATRNVGTKAEWAPAYKAGVRVFQAPSDPRPLYAWCAAQ